MIYTIPTYLSDTSLGGRFDNFPRTDISSKNKQLTNGRAVYYTYVIVQLVPLGFLRNAPQVGDLTKCSLPASW